ncbi:hypothetical protein LAZ67_2005852 [Cordylochernes scorpioides]|uniref:Uncharacterized protein n=1 Tax=Cordylochernes scorpioides TaxID=51811 RepID=A0ABY6K5K2_9ARAC|nr:hypothetical protein LAZ67_2005852 [Cordylochernes scorpioides]
MGDTSVELKKSKDNSIFRKSYGDDFFFFCLRRKIEKRRTYLANKNFIFHFTNIPSHLPGVIAIILHELLIAETVAYFGGVLDNSHMKLDKFCDVHVVQAMVIMVGRSIPCTNIQAPACFEHPNFFKVKLPENPINR